MHAGIVCGAIEALRDHVSLSFPMKASAGRGPAADDESLRCAGYPIGSANPVMSTREYVARPEAALLLDLSEVIQQRRRIAIGYRSHHDQVTHRTVDPYAWPAGGVIGVLSATASYARATGCFAWIVCK